MMQRFLLARYSRILWAVSSLMSLVATEAARFALPQGWICIHRRPMMGAMVCDRSGSVLVEIRRRLFIAPHGLVGLTGLVLVVLIMTSLTNSAARRLLLATILSLVVLHQRVVAWRESSSV